MSLIAILARDGWRCLLCGIETPQRLRGTTHPHAPEIGHIIPKCRGGDDSPENLRCECKKCNHRKGGLLDGEFGGVFTRSGMPVDFVAIEASTAAICAGGRIGGHIGGRIGGRIGGPIGGRRVHELHPDLAANNGRIGNREGKSRGGRIGGCIAAKSGQLAKAALKGGRIAAKSGQLAKTASKGGRIANHNRWHVARGIINPGFCALCH